jgi:group I intron endonuclease
MRHSGIYSIQNLLNNKVYVGQSVNIHRRWTAHRSDLRRGKHGNGHLQRSWDKYGPAAFAFTVLEIVPTKDQRAPREAYYCNLLGAFLPETGYNQNGVLGVADASPALREKRRVNRLGKKDSPETRLRKSIGRFGIPMREDTKKKLAAWHTGRKATAATKAKLSLMRIGKAKGPTSDATKEKISASLRESPAFQAAMRVNGAKRKGLPGHPQTIETRERIAAAHRGKAKPPLSAEAKAKISQFNMGRKKSPETLQKMSDSAKLREARKRCNQEAV